MKSKILTFVLAFILVLPAVLFAGCFGGAKSLLVALPENSYEGELTYTTNYGAVCNWDVIHRREMIGDTEYLVHYLQYVYTNGEDVKTSNYLGVWDESVDGTDKWVVYVLKDNTWKPGSTRKSDGREEYGTDKYDFDYHGADFNRHALEARFYPFSSRNLVEETDEYILYNEHGDIFKLSNNIYHICLYRGGENGGCDHEFTRFTFNESTTAIPFINTLVL